MSGKKRLEDFLNKPTDCLLTDFAPDHTPIVRIKGFGAPIFIKCPREYEKGRKFFFETLGYHFDKNSERKLKRTEKQRRFQIRLVGRRRDEKGSKIGFAYFIPDRRYN